jgi:hypothetical protein
MKLRFKPRLSGQSITVLAILLSSLGFLGYHLSSLTAGLQLREQVLPPVSASLERLWNQPLELPLTMSRLLVAAALPDSGTWQARMPSVALGLLIIMLTYWLLLKWYGYRLALFGITLLITTPWFLHVSRLATTDIVYPFGMIILLALAALWHQSKRRLRLLYMSAVAAAIVLYIPGAIWLLVGIALLERRHLLSSLRAGRHHSIAAVAIGLVLLAPLIHALIVNWHMYRSLLGLPAILPSPLHYLQQFYQVWQHIFISSYNDPLYNIAGLPALDVLTSIAFLVGVYLYAQHRRAVRTKQILYLWLSGTALIALGGPVGLSLLLPVVIVVATCGLGYILHLWLKVFPRNPVARAFGIGLLSLVLVFAVAYNVRNYFVAWPQNATTQALFQAQQ